MLFRGRTLMRQLITIPLSTSATSPWWGWRLFVVLLGLASLIACSFSYDLFPVVDDEKRPDVVMNSVEYVRVRNGEPIVRIQAERAERYENDQIMLVDKLLFSEHLKDEQTSGTVGAAGASRVDLASGDVDLYGGVKIVVQQEDLAIDTQVLSWRNEERVLLGADDIPVQITRSDGSTISGTGFGVSARKRSFEFNGNVTGTYVDSTSEEASLEESSPEEAEPVSPEIQTTDEPRLADDQSPETADSQDQPAGAGTAIQPPPEPDEASAWISIPEPPLYLEDHDL